MLRKWRVVDRLWEGFGAGVCGLLFGPIAAGLLFLFVAIGAPASDPDIRPRGNVVLSFFEIVKYGYSYPFYIPIACAVIGFVAGVVFSDPDKADEVARREEEFKARMAKKAAQDEALEERLRERRRQAAIRKDEEL